MWRLGRYRVDDRPFASGATAEVFTARKGRAGSRVAIKLLPLKTYRERAEAEAAFATIDHPRLLSVHERVVDERRGVIGLVMDLMPEGDLRSALRGGDEPSPEEMLRIADDVLAALEALHAVGLVHRDVKPENVLLERVDGELRARLGDMGTARPVDRTPTTGSVLGTDLYIAPEVHDGQPPSAAADLWALGYVLYEGLFGAPPHAGAATTYQAIGRLRTEGPDRPPNVPDSVWAVVAQLLAPRPGDRPRSAAAARLVGESARDAARTATIGRVVDADGQPRRRKSAGNRRSVSSSLPVGRRRLWGRGAFAAAVAAAVGVFAWGPVDLFGQPASATGVALAVTPLAADEPSVVPTQYQWRLRDGVVSGRLDVTNASEEPTPVTTMPELFPKEAVREGRLPLRAFDGVQERQDDGSVLVRFAVPALEPGAHHVVAFALEVGSTVDDDGLAALVRNREAAINRHAFNLSNAPTLEHRAVNVDAATIAAGETTALRLSGTTHDRKAAPEELLRDVHYEVVSGSGVVSVDGNAVRGVAPGVAVVRAVVGLLRAEVTVRVRQTDAPTTTRVRVTRPPATQPTTTTTDNDGPSVTVLPGNENIVVE
jgi:tRNA A-37 threonylcarbamoyl transferase component Bud32